MFNNSAEKFRKKFKPVHQEIDFLTDKIHEKSGLIFKTHTYTKEQLLKSKHASKIYSMTQKIGDDAQNWYKRGTLDEAGKAAYEHEREAVDDRFHQAKREISRRQPTFWESVKEGFDEFITVVMENMPDLTKNMIEKLLPSLSSLLTPIKRLIRLPAPDTDRDY